MFDLGEEERVIPCAVFLPCASVPTIHAYIKLALY